MKQTQLDDIPAPDMSLEREADRLLKEVGATNHRCSMKDNEGIYTERQFRGHRRREFTNNEAAFDRCIEIAEIEERDMILDDVRLLCRLAGLSDEQTLIWSLHHEGVSCQDIGNILKITRQAAQSRIQRCQCRLMRTIAMLPYLFWYGVYLSEVNRHD